MIGIDTVETARIARAAERRHFLERVFTEGERAYYEKSGRAETLAGIWCVKEAVAKALGTGIAFALTDIETVHDENGKPEARLHGKAAQLLRGRQVDISITHTRTAATAIAIIS